MATTALLAACRRHLSASAEKADTATVSWPVEAGRLLPRAGAVVLLRAREMTLSLPAAGSASTALAGNLLIWWPPAGPWSHGAAGLRRTPAHCSTPSGNTFRPLQVVKAGSGVAGVDPAFMRNEENERFRDGSAGSGAQSPWNGSNSLLRRRRRRRPCAGPDCLCSALLNSVEFTTRRKRSCSRKAQSATTLVLVSSTPLDEAVKT